MAEIHLTDSVFVDISGKISIQNEYYYKYLSNSAIDMKAVF